MVDKLYLLPVETIVDESGRGRGPKYINWHWTQEDGFDYHYSMKDYGFAPFMLVLVKGIIQADHDWLIGNSDVYAYPELDQLNQPIPPQDNLSDFFEGIGVPTDWLTPASTYLEFLRQNTAMFLFHQRYGNIVYEASGEFHDLIADVGGLDVRFNSWDPQVQDWFEATLVDFGYPAVSGNPQLRHLMKRAGDQWADSEFGMGGYIF